MSPYITIPPGVFYLALTSLVAMSERPTFKVKQINSTCRSIAESVCRKLEIGDTKLKRHLTNRLVSYGLENLDVFRV